jgi:tRNA dimethylallyltransferase
LLSPLVVVLGPTGSGKSALGLVLAEAFRGEIIHCDSIQVYRRLNIGSAKFSPELRRGIPHHLIDILSPEEELTAAAYSYLAREELAKLQRKGTLPIVVGGTGFYLKALLDGLSPAPARDEKIRARLRNMALRRPLSLSRFLRRRDPEAAKRIHPNDTQKLIRAIELTLLAGQPATATQNLPRNTLRGFKILKLGLAPRRDLLYDRLNRRSTQMFEDGLIAETKEILDAGLAPDAKALQSLGYKQASDVLTKNVHIAEAIQECQVKTRQYAKRQMTWFRREPDVNWLRGFGSEESIQNQAFQKTEIFLRDVLEPKQIMSNSE